MVKREKEEEEEVMMKKKKKKKTRPFFCRQLQHVFWLLGETPLPTTQEISSNIFAVPTTFKRETPQGTQCPMEAQDAADK